MLKKILLNLTGKTLGTTGGTDYSVAWQIKGISDLASLVAFLHAKNNAGSTPTLNVNLQYSWDNSHWYDTGLAFTQVTTSTDSDESKAWGTNKIGPYLRVKYVIGGTATPSYDIWVAISSLGDGGSWGN